jgi:hypothetical protein
MQSTPVNKPGRVISWMTAGVFGIPGLYDLVSGALDRNAGLAMYGLGAAMIAAVFVWFALASHRAPTSRARILRLVLGYSGLAVAICGFVMKHRGIS